MHIKYTKELLEPIVANCRTYAGVVRALGLRQAGGTQTHVSRRIKSFGLDTSHFLGQGVNRGAAHRGGPSRKNASQILILQDEFASPPKTQQLKRALAEIGIPDECALCGLGPIWNNRVLVLQVDHIDGKRYDSRRENLRLLCPNCHSQTETFCKNRRL